MYFYSQRKKKKSTEILWNDIEKIKEEMKVDKHIIEQIYYLLLKPKNKITNIRKVSYFLGSF